MNTGCLTLPKAPNPVGNVRLIIRLEFDEHRYGMYTTEIFSGERDLHVGLDIGAPIDTPVYCFADGVVFSKGINSEDGSYGYNYNHAT